MVGTYRYIIIKRAVIYFILCIRALMAYGVALIVAGSRGNRLLFLCTETGICKSTVCITLHRIPSDKFSDYTNEPLLK